MTFSHSTASHSPSRRGGQFAVVQRMFAAIACAALLLGGCASTTDILRSSNEAIPAKPIRTLFVAGVSTDDEMRQRYENVFVAELAKDGIKGIPSSTLIPSTGGLTMPEIRAKMHAASADADAVLHVQLIELAPAPTLAPGDVPADSAPASRTVNGIALTLNAPPAGGVRGSQYEVELQATLYELPQRKLLWTVATRTHEANTLEAVAHSHARALIAAMRKAGFLAAGK